MKLYPSKAPFLEDHILVPRGCCASEFLHVLENDQVLPVHSTEDGGAFYNLFFKGVSKIGLKFSV